MNRKFRFLVIFMMLLASFLFTGCNSGSSEDNPITPPPAPTPTTVAVESISLDQTALILAVGGTETLTATVEPSDATDKSVTWSSDNNGVATVDDNGKVTGVSVGTATITVTTTDGTKAADCTVAVTAAPTPSLPVGALSGVFTVADDGAGNIKKVHFSQGNMYYDGSAFKFEINQYDVQNSWNTSHVSHFYWSKTASVAYAQSYVDGSASTSDVLFTNDPTDAEKAKADFTVNGVTGKYRTLSSAEWDYLLNTRTMAYGKVRYSNAVSGVSIGGITYNGIFLYPDDYNGDDVSSSMTWEQINAAGIVFLPAAGYHYDNYVNYVGSNGYYWSSKSNHIENADFLNFSLSNAVMDSSSRYTGRSVRLVCTED